MEYVQDKEAFIDAVRLGDTDKVAGFLQEQPAIVYARYGLSRNPLHFAIELRHAGVAKLLIATCPALLADTDAAGKKPLEYADQALTSLLSETVAAYEKQAAEPFASVPATTAGGHQRNLNRGPLGARQLAGMIADYLDKLTLADAGPIRSYRTETVGLLKGIEFGSITRGEPKIGECLREFVAGLEAAGVKSYVSRPVSQLLQLVGAAGLSATTTVIADLPEMETLVAAIAPDMFADASRSRIR